MNRSEHSSLIAYLEARRDAQEWSDKEWSAATGVIDWIRAQLEAMEEPEKISHSQSKQ